jgi:acetyltransferase
MRTYRRVGEVPEPIDLAIITGRATAVPELVGECVDAGVKTAVIAATGIWAGSPEGLELARWIEVEVRQGGMRVIGPNSFGVMNPYSGLNATPSAMMARPGSVAFLSQSAGMCQAILDWSLRERVGLSALVSVGSMVDVGWGDLIDYLGSDPETRSIVIDLETLGDARRFAEAASRVALSKPILVLKSGREGERGPVEGGWEVPWSEDEVLDCLLSRCGVLRVHRLSELFAMAEVLGKQAWPRGPRLAILTNAAGPGRIAADALREGGGELARLSAETVAALDSLLPARWSRTNPVDVLDDADPERVGRAAELVAADPGVDGVLVILTPSGMADPTCVASRVRRLGASEKPILASWMGGVGVLAGTELLNRAGITTFSHPDTAARAFCSMWRSRRNRERLCEGGSSIGSWDEAGGPEHAPVVRSLRVTGRSVLDEAEARALLAAYGLPSVPTFARDLEEAVRRAGELGYPVRLKPLTKEPLGESWRLGGELEDDEALRSAYEALQRRVAREAGAGSFLGVSVWPVWDRRGVELAVSSHVDPVYGPVLSFGLGGGLGRIYGDRALGLPPLSLAEARRMIGETRVGRALLEGVGVGAVDVGEIERFLVRFSRLVEEQRWIRRIEVDPLVAEGNRLMALGVRVESWDGKVPEDERPSPVLGRGWPERG